MEYSNAGEKTQVFKERKWFSCADACGTDVQCGGSVSSGSCGTASANADRLFLMAPTGIFIPYD